MQNVKHTIFTYTLEIHNGMHWQIPNKIWMFNKFSLGAENRHRTNNLSFKFNDSRYMRSLLDFFTCYFFQHALQYDKNIKRRSFKSKVVRVGTKTAATMAAYHFTQSFVVSMSMNILLKNS